MKSSRGSKLLPVALPLLLLIVLSYLSWQRYHHPAPRTHEGKTLNEWLEDLNDPDSSVSDRAADVLVKIGEEAVTTLIDASEQGDIRLHRRSAAVLVRIGAPAVPRLVDSLKDKARQSWTEVTLVRIGPAAVPSLRDALSEEKAGEAAAHVLGLMGTRAAEAVPDLIAILNRPQAATPLKREAAFALGRIGEPTAAIVPVLIDALRDPKREVREQAAEALGWIGPPARQAEEPLIAALKDEDMSVAIKACQALCFVGDTKSASALLAAFQGVRAEVALEAGTSLWRLGPPADRVVPELLSSAQGPMVKAAPARNLLASFGPRIVPVLVQALHADEAARRQLAAEILACVGPPARAAVPALLDALRDKASAVALMAAVALAQIDSTRCGAAVPILADAVDVPDAILALANIGPDARSAVSNLVAALKPGKGNSPNQMLRSAAARVALARIGRPAVPALIEALKDKQGSVAPLAGEALAWILPPPKEAVPALCAALKNDRAKAPIYAHSLGQLGSVARSAVPDLTGLLTDSSCRAEAAVALVRIDPHQAERAIPPLIGDLQGDDEQLRREAVLALARMGPAAEAAAEELVTLLRDRLLTEVEISALREIWPKAVPSLATLLKGPHVEVRKRALYALGQIGARARAALSPLIEVLSDRDSSLRVGAAQVIQSIGIEGKEAVPSLVANLQASQAEVRAAAAAALGHIEAGAMEGRRSLLECLLDPDESVRYAAALSLGRIDPHYTEAVPALRAALSDSSPMVQLAAIDSLSHIEPEASKDTRPILVSLCLKPYPLQIRFRTVEGITALLGPEAAKIAVPWLTIELTDANPENALYAARLLANIEKSRSSSLVLALAAMLRTPLPEARRAILRTLAEFGTKAREVSPDIERLLYDGAPGMRSDAIRALRAINPDSVKKLGVD